MTKEIKSCENCKYFDSIQERPIYTGRIMSQTIITKGLCRIIEKDQDRFIIKKLISDSDRNNICEDWCKE